MSSTTTAMMLRMRCSKALSSCSSIGPSIPALGRRRLRPFRHGILNCLVFVLTAGKLHASRGDSCTVRPELWKSELRVEGQHTLLVGLGFLGGVEHGVVAPLLPAWEHIPPVLAERLPRLAPRVYPQRFAPVAQVNDHPEGL